MLSEDEIKAHKKLVEKVNSLAAKKQEIITTAKNKKLQGLEILKKYGYTSTSDVSKLQEKLDVLEAQIKEEAQEAEKEILAINELQEQVNSLLLR